MWSTLGIVGVGCVCAAALFAVGALIVFKLARRRDRRIMQRHGFAGNLTAYHQSRLSATENNYTHVSAPNAALRRSTQPGSIPGIWDTLPSEDYIRPETAANTRPDDGPEPPKAKRRKSLRASFYGHSFHVPKIGRQKKIDSNVSLGQMPRSPLSAITEFTGSTDGPVVAELAAEHTPKETSDKAGNLPPAAPWPLLIRKTRSEQELVHGDDNLTRQPSFTRSVSARSTMYIAPEEPLPPLPSFDIYKHHRSQGGRTSTASVDTMESSVFGTFMSSPSRVSTDITIPTLGSEMQSFDFGFNVVKGSTRLGAPPGRQTMTGYVAGKSGITSIRPSFDYDLSKSMGTPSTRQDSLQTIDAGGWNRNFDLGSRSNLRSAIATTRHSWQDCGHFFAKKGPYNDDVLDHAERCSFPPRLASVASGNPYQWDLKPAFAAVRHSAGSADSARKGHRRRNCVRITDLPAVEPRNSKVGQMPELAEEQSYQTETPPVNKTKIPGLDLLEAGQPILRARASLVDIRGSPSPIRNRLVLLPTRPKRPHHFRTSISASGLSRRDSDVFSTAQPSPTTPVFQSSRQLPLSPTPPTSIKMNANMPPPHDSPTLPSPIYAARPRTSQVRGPRSLPVSNTAPRSNSPTPALQKPMAKKTEDDLRRSVMLLRSMNSEGRLLDQSNRHYRNIGVADDGTASSATSTSSTMNNLSLFPIDYRRQQSQTVNNHMGPSRSKMSITMSPSTVSMGGASIWEDASVRGDSPEPDVPTSRAMSIAIAGAETTASRGSTILAPQPRTPQTKIPYPNPEASENIENMISHGKAFQQRKYSTSTPQGKGLGITLSPQRTVGLTTPGSLYDTDGFLKD